MRSAFRWCVSLGPQHGGRHRAGARLPGPRWRDAEHHRLPRRHLERAPLHECAAFGRHRQAGGGAQVGPQAGRQRGGARRTAAPSSAATKYSTPRCAAPARCACVRSSSCSRRPSAWRRATVRSDGGWRSSPTAADPGVLAADWVSEIDLQLGKLSPHPSTRCVRRSPAIASLSDLIDLSEEASPEHYRAAIEAAGSGQRHRWRARHSLAQGTRRCRAGGAHAGRGSSMPSASRC